MARARPILKPSGLVLTLVAAALVAVLSAAPAHPDTTRAQLHPDNPIGALAAGKLLVAAPRVGDPNFSQTVVLLFAYSPDGAAGLIVDRPSPVPISRVLPDLPAPAATPHVFFGGPVAMTDIRALLQAAVGSGDSLQLLPGLHLLLNRAAVDEAVAAGVTADRLRVFAGYAGWDAQQLAAGNPTRRLARLRGRGGPRLRCGA